MADRRNATSGQGRRTVDELRPGTSVTVRCRFDGSWVDGFEVAEAVPGPPLTYRLRRIHDASLLPATFDPADLRRDAVDPSADRAWVHARRG